jgi:integrase
MAGRRSLTREEERRLLRAVRVMSPRDRALVTAQWMTGFRISEVLRWTVGTVLRNEEIVSKIGLPPRQMKGGYGKTRWVPLLPELRRALESYLGWLERRLVLSPDLPLFLSRENDGAGNARANSCDMARHVIKAAFARAKIEDDGRLGSHSLRKTWATRLFEASGHNLLIVSAGLNHSSVAVTQRYLEPNEDEVIAAMNACDFTRGPRRRPLQVETKCRGCPPYLERGPARTHCTRGSSTISAGARPIESSAAMVRIGESMCVKNFL